MRGGANTARTYIAHATHLECGVGRDDRGKAARAVRVVRGARQDGALADGHLGEAFVPAPDDLKAKGFGV